MEILKTAPGKLFQCDSLSTIPEPFRVYIHITGASIGEVAAVFSDPSETERLEYGSITMTGCTRLLAIIPEGDAVRVNLTRGESNS